MIAIIKTMDIVIIRDLAILFGLGMAGWALFNRLRFPVAPFLGSLIFLTIFRALGIPVPLSPDWLFPLLQVCLGLYIGSKITRDTMRDIKSMLSATIIIITWALSIVFLLGPFLAWATSLDLYTAILSSSMGGLPEITMIAMATDANLGFIIMMQLLRMLITVALFPLIIKRWMTVNQPEIKQKSGDLNLISVINGGTNKKADTDEEKADALNHDMENDSSKKIKKEKLTLSFHSYGRVILVLTAAGLGGLVLNYLGVPAGIMVGSTIAVGIITLAGVKPVNISPPVFNIILVALGIAVADNIVPEEFVSLGEPVLLFPVIIATVIIFLTSFMVTYLIHKISGWDLPTSFLAAAPGGFSIMVALSIRYDKDPFKVSMLHLCRLLSLKIALPFVFMYFI